MVVEIPETTCLTAYQSNNAQIFEEDDVKISLNITIRKGKGYT